MRRHPDVLKLYAEMEYLDAYSRHTDLRVEADPQAAVGGRWEEIGRLQFDFMVRKGLRPHHTMLDLGCGTLRGGRHFIRYLDPGHYQGMDISPKAIAYGRQLVDEEGLADKQPRLLLSEGKDLQFQAFRGTAFDYILAQSVFTHLKPAHIEECFQHVGTIMRAGSAFYFTFNRSETHRQATEKDFAQPFAFFESLADAHGHRLRDCSSEYDHPRGQSMVELTRRSPAAPVNSPAGAS